MSVIGPVMMKELDDVVEMFAEDLSSLNIEHERAALHRIVETVIDDPSHSILWGIRAKARGPLEGVLFANIFRSVKHAGPALWLEQLYVRPRARRLGLGKELVNALLDWAEENGIQGIDLESYRLNAPASILYRTLGFRRLGRERFTLELWDEEESE